MQPEFGTHTVEEYKKQMQNAKTESKVYKFINKQKQGKTEVSIEINTEE